jgi:hypothetical protein
MDVPYIKSRYMPRAKVYGSTTMRNTLLAFKELKSDDIVSVQDGAGTHEAPGKWWHDPSGRVRFMALVSEHAPIVFGLKFFEGAYDAPLTDPPRRAYQWREGQTLAYLIDFLAADGKTVEFRIHYQDAASTPNLGFPPPAQPDDRRVDVAIVCLPGFDQVRDYPTGIVGRLKPRFVVGTHWEDFFALLPNEPKDLHTVPTLDAHRFIEKLRTALPQDAEFRLPVRGVWMRFPPAP